MPSAASLAAAAAFLVAGGLSAGAARLLVAEVEDRSAEAVRLALAGGGQDWAGVVADGLQVVIEGRAPSEAERFRAISAAGSAVDASRVIDNMRVAPTRELDPPDFAVEILRNGAGLSLAGLIPEAGRERFEAELARAAGGEPVADLLQVADYPVPEGWEEALGFALDALPGLPASKVSVSAGRVAVEAVAESEAARDRLQAELVRMKPEGVRLALAVEAPRPVAAPFTLRARLEGGALAFDACVADTEEALEAILAAAREAGAGGPVECRLALGSPSPDWGKAAALGLGALGRLGAGTLAFSDADVALVGAAGTDPALFARVAAELGGALPQGFSLRPEPPPEAGAAPAGPAEFRATLSPEGAARLEGMLPGPALAETARTFAQARFGADKVTLATGSAEGLPEGWSVRVLAGLQALDGLGAGEVRVTPGLVAVTGRSGDRGAREAIAAGLLAALGPEAEVEVEVAYDEALDPLAALPTPEECLAEIEAATAGAKITFDPGSATLSGDGRQVVGRIAQILKPCGGIRLRIAGYTDSQGRESSNLELSQARAEAVLAALRDERVPTAGFEAVGFGEEGPIADNGTEAGREANRRIEFSLIGAAAPAPEGAGPAPAEGAAAAPGRPSARPAGAPSGPPGAAQGGEASVEEAVDAAASGG